MINVSSNLIKDLVFESYPENAIVLNLWRKSFVTYCSHTWRICLCFYK